MMYLLGFIAFSRAVMKFNYFVFQRDSWQSMLSLFNKNVPFLRLKIVSAEDASNLALTLNSLTSEPGLYSSILHNASKLVHENLHFAVKVGRNIKNECEVEKVQDMADGPMMGFNDSPVCSKFQGVFETCEDLLPDLMKFKACCIRSVLSIRVKIFSGMK